MYKKFNAVARIPRDKLVDPLQVYVTMTGAMVIREAEELRESNVEKSSKAHFLVSISSSKRFSKAGGTMEER